MANYFVASQQPGQLAAVEHRYLQQLVGVHELDRGQELVVGANPR